jgi:low affinity Fe/Cu permease
MRRRGTMLNYFSKFARYISQIAGGPSAFIVVCFVVILWIITGPIFYFSVTWQLIINTATNIITLLMAFIIQNTQNRDGEAMQIKLDELILAHRDAHKVLLDLEELTQDQLDLIRKKYEKLAREARRDLGHDTKKAKPRKT